MTDFPTLGLRFAGLGASAGAATEAARVLAERLDHWCADHPTCRILDLKIQSSAIGTQLHLSAIIAYVEDAPLDYALIAAAEASYLAESDALAQAEEIVAEAQHEDQ